MYDDIEFLQDWFAEVETFPGRMRQVAFRRGTRLRSEVCSIGREEGTVELVNLHLADGTIARRVPLGHFAVVKRQQARAA